MGALVGCPPLEERSPGECALVSGVPLSGEDFSVLGALVTGHDVGVIWQAVMSTQVDLHPHVLFFQIHRDERPFHCSVCQLTFRHKNSLVRHMIRHTGEQPYNCKVCKKKFNNVDRLKNHVKKAHPPTPPPPAPPPVPRPAPPQQQDPLGSNNGNHDVGKPLLTTAPAPAQATMVPPPYPFTLAPAPTAAAAPTPFTNFTSDMSTLLIQNIAWDPNNGQPIFSAIPAANQNQQQQQILSFVNGGTDPGAVFLSGPLVSLQQQQQQQQVSQGAYQIEVIDVPDDDEPTNATALTPTPPLLPKESLMEIAMQEITGPSNEEHLLEMKEGIPKQQESAKEATDIVEGKTLPPSLKSISQKVDALKAEATRSSTNDVEEKPKGLKCEKCGKHFKYSGFFEIHRKRDCVAASS